METADDMDDVMKKCEGISVDLPVSVEDASISFFDNVIHQQINEIKNKL